MSPCVLFVIFYTIYYQICSRAYSICALEPNAKISSIPTEELSVHFKNPHKKCWRFKECTSAKWNPEFTNIIINRMDTFNGTLFALFAVRQKPTFHLYCNFSVPHGFMQVMILTCRTQKMKLEFSFVQQNNSQNIYLHTYKDLILQRYRVFPIYMSCVYCCIFFFQCKWITFQYKKCNYSVQ